MSSEQKTVEIIVNGQKAGATIKEMEASARALNAQIRGLKPGTEEFVTAAKKLDGVREGLKKTKDEAYNVGSAFKKFIGHASELPLVGKGVQGLGAAFNMALGPIGLVITAVTFVIGILKRFAFFIDEAEAAFAGMNAGIVEAVNQVGEFARAMGALASGNAKPFLDILGQGWQGITVKILAAASAGSALERQMKALSDAKRADRVTDSAVEAQIDILIEKSKNLALTWQERIAFLDKAQKLEEEKFAGDVKLINDEIALQEKFMLTKTKLTKTEMEQFLKGELERKDIIERIGQVNETEFDKLADLYVQRNKQEQNSVALSERINSRKESMMEKRSAAEQKDIDKKERDDATAEAKRVQRQAKEEADRQKVVDSTKKMLNDLAAAKTSTITNEQEREEAMLLDELLRKKEAVKAEVGDEKVKNQLILALDEKYVHDLEALKKKHRDAEKEEQMKWAMEFVTDAKGGAAEIAEAEARERLASKELAVQLTKEGTVERRMAEEAYLVERMNQELKLVGLTESEVALIREKYRAAAAQKDRETAVHTAEEIVSFTKQATDSVLKIVSNREEAELAEDKKKVDGKKKNLKKQLDAGQISREAYDAKISEMDDAYEKRKGEIKKKAFERERAAAILQAIIATALAIVKALPNPILATAAGILGGLQIGVIASQPTPEFSKGGILPGPSHSAGGLPIINPYTGRKVAEVEGNEAFISKQAVANNRALVDALIWSGHHGGAPISPWYSSMPSPVNYGAMSRSITRFAEGGIFQPGTSGTGSTAQGGGADLQLFRQALDNNTMATLQLVKRLGIPIEAVFSDEAVRDIRTRIGEFDSIQNNSTV